MKITDLSPSNSPKRVRVDISVSSAQGGRKYMEDEYSIVKYEPFTDTLRDSQVLHRPFLFLAIFDGHGGNMAAQYSKHNLCRNIVRYRDFWSDDDNRVCLAIHKGFVRTQREMMKEVVNWPKTNLGFPSTSGTTASVLFVMNGKYYTGHVGDSRIVLGRSDSFNRWSSYPMTRDHKPESPKERKRIEDAGGQVMIKSGIGRVVWKRPKLNCDISFDVIPFLAVARSLGDLWSLNTQLDTFVVSPEPDVHCVPINPLDRCLVLASDGLWNMVSSRKAIILAAETHNGGANLDEAHPQQSSTSSYLLHHCLDLWAKSRCRADNTTVLAAMFDMTDTHCGFDSNEAHFDCTDLTSTFIGDTIHSRNISYSKQTRHQEACLQLEIESIMENILDRVCLDESKTESRLNEAKVIFDSGISPETELTEAQLSLIQFDSDLPGSQCHLSQDGVLSLSCATSIARPTALYTNKLTDRWISSYLLNQSFSRNLFQSHSHNIALICGNDALLNYHAEYNLLGPTCDNSYDDTSSCEAAASSDTLYDSSSDSAHPPSTAQCAFYSESLDSNILHFNPSIPAESVSTSSASSFVDILPSFALKRACEEDNPTSFKCNSFKRFCSGQIDSIEGKECPLESANINRNGLVHGTAGQCVKEFLSSSMTQSRHHSMEIPTLTAITE